MKVWKDNLLTWPHCGKVWVPIPGRWTWLCKLFRPKGWWYRWDKQRRCACLRNWLCLFALQWSSGRTIHPVWPLFLQPKFQNEKWGLHAPDNRWSTWSWSECSCSLKSVVLPSSAAGQPLLLMDVRVKGCGFKSMSLRWLVLWHYCVNKWQGQAISRDSFSYSL